MKIKERILTDEPLTDPKNDLLGFKKFAKNLAMLIWMNNKGSAGCPKTLLFLDVEN